MSQLIKALNQLTHDPGNMPGISDRQIEMEGALRLLPILSMMIAIYFQHSLSLSTLETIGGSIFQLRRWLFFLIPNPIIHYLDAERLTFFTMKSSSRLVTWFCQTIKRNR